MIHNQNQHPCTKIVEQQRPLMQSPSYAAWGTGGSIWASNYCHWDIHVHDRGALYYYACAFHLDGQGMFPPPPPIPWHAQLASCHGTTSETSLSLCGWVERDDEGDGDWRYGSGGQSSGGSHSHRPQTKWRVGVPLLQGWRPKVRKTNYYLNLVQIHHSCEWAGMLNLDY